MESFLLSKKIRARSGLTLTLASCLLLSACNIWDDDDKEPSVTTSGELKGYYKDSEVVGLPYQCGADSGLTGSEGEFFFSQGDSCEFFLDTAMEHPIREIAAETLFDDVVIFETNPLIGQTLQSLDSDGNPDNGIDINQEVVAAVIADEGFNGVPADESEADALSTIIDNNNGDDVGVVTSSEAQAHMLETLLTSGSMYQHCSGRVAGKALSKIDFSGGNLSLNDETSTNSYSFEDSGVVVTTSDGSSETYTNNSDTLASSNESVNLKDSSGNEHTFYFSAESALAGDADSCAFGDTTAPVITLNGEASQSVAYQGAFTDAGASATDDVDATVEVSSNSSVDISTLGAYSVTYSASDAAGNIATEVTRTVNVTDQTAPTITLSGDSVTTVAQGAGFDDAGATASDDVDGDVAVTISGSVDTGVIGSYVITYNAVDAAENEATSVTRTVNVTDQTVPVISLIGAPALTIAHGSSYSDSGASVVDNVDSTLTASSSGSVDTSTVGTYVITYSSTDAAGNDAATLTRTITVEDQTPPVITLTGSNEITVAHNSPYTEQGATAVDTVDGSLSVIASDTVDTSALGTYVVAYNVADAAGNAATEVTRTVVVADQVAPVITLNGEPSVSILVDADYEDAGATASDDGDASLTVVSDLNTVLDVSTPGTYTITYNVADAQGNAADPVTRTINVISGIAFNLPESLYQLDVYENSGNDTYEYDAQEMRFNSDGTFVNLDSEFIAGQFYENTFQADDDFVLKNGEWVKDDASSWSLVLSELDTIATLDDRYQLTITNRTDVSGESVELDGLIAPVVMPAGSEKTGINVSTLETQYEIDRRSETHGNTQNVYYQSLSEVIENQCENRFFNYVDSPNFYGISFTCGEENQTSGTLTGVAGYGVYVPNVGTWELVTLPDSTIPAVITYIDPDQLTPGSEDSVDNIMYAMFGDEVWKGQEVSTAGRSFSFDTYNQTAFNAINDAVLAETFTDGTDEFQVVDGKLSLKSIADESDIDSDSKGSTSINRYGYSKSSPDRNDAIIESFQADISLVDAQVSVYAPNPSYSTRSRIGFTHQVISESSGYRSSVALFLEHGTNGSDQTIFKAWHSIYDASGSLVNEEGLPGIHFETAALDTEYNIKMETVEGGWKYTAGSYTATLLASSFDMNNDGTNESFEDFITRKAYLFNRVKYATEVNDSAEGTVDNIVYEVSSLGNETLTVTQDFDRYENGTRPILDDELFNDIHITTSKGVTLVSEHDGVYDVLASPSLPGCSGASGHMTITDGVVSGEVLSGYIVDGVPETKVWSLSGYAAEFQDFQAGVAATDTSDSADYSGTFQPNGGAVGSWVDSSGCKGVWTIKERVSTDFTQSYLTANPWYAVSTASACMAKFEFSSEGTATVSFGNPAISSPSTYSFNEATEEVIMVIPGIGGASFLPFVTSDSSFTAESQITGDADSSVAVFFKDYQEAINYGEISGNESCSDFIPE